MLQCSGSTHVVVLTPEFSFVSRECDADDWSRIISDVKTLDLGLWT